MSLPEPKVFIPCEVIGETQEHLCISIIGDLSNYFNKSVFWTKKSRVQNGFYSAKLLEAWRTIPIGIDTPLSWFFCLSPDQNFGRL